MVGAEERVVFCVNWRGYYLAVKLRGRYRRLHGFWL